jgi:CubicO group peptidase (beta-lactamase class C family)
VTFRTTSTVAGSVSVGEELTQKSIFRRRIRTSEGVIATRSSFLTFVLVLVLSLFTPSVEAASSDQPDWSTQTLEKLLDPIAKKNLEKSVGSVITVVHDGQIVFSKGYGSARLETKKMVDPEKTLFRIGSISKTFTAIAVMRLVEQGKLELDADINTYLRAFKVTSPFGNPITMRHLLTHTAGFEESSEQVFFERTKDMGTLEQTLGNRLPKIVRPPGVAPMYSNHGIALAGYIVQVVSQEPYAQYIQENIIGPLGMTHSSALQPLPSNLVADMASGYGSGDPKKLSVKPFELVSISPAGAISATGSDMTRYMRMLLNGGELEGKRILKSSTLEAMFAPQFRFQPSAVGQGFVFWRELLGGELVISHAGDTQWFHSEMMLFPKEKLGIFWSVNSTDGSLQHELRDTLRKTYFKTRIPKLGGEINPRSLQGISGSSYRKVRLIEDTFTKLLGLIQLHPSVSRNGQLEMRVSVIPGQNLELVQTAPLVYRVVKSPTESQIGNDGFSFSKDGQYMIQESDYTAFERVSAVENDYLHLGLLAFGLLSSLGVIVGAAFRSIRKLVRRLRKLERLPKQQRWKGILTLTSATAFILVPLCVAIGLPQFIESSKVPPILYAGATLSIVAGLLTVGLFVTSVQSWRNHWWTTFARLRYSVMTLASIGMLFFLNTWHLLGFRF